MRSGPKASWSFRFGTNGWRGVFGEDFTLPRLRIVLRGVAAWLAGSGSPVLVAHDTRSGGEQLTRTAVAVLREVGLETLVADGPTATPVVARAVSRQRAAAALVFTASHNPQNYHGLKIVGPDGSCIGSEAARQIETLVARSRDAAATSPSDAPEVEPLGPDSTVRVDLCTPYIGEVLSRIDTEAIRRARIGVVYDAMHGAGSGVLDRVLERAGALVRVRRGEADPTFGGGTPDPIRANLGGLCDEVRSMQGLRIGLATDGDADRFAVVDADGQLLSETESVALLVDHLARTGRISSGVAVSMASGSLVSRVAADHGLPVVRHPIGFSHLARTLHAGECDVAGEESGGFAVASFNCDKDGIMAGALMLELAASIRAPLRTRLDELERRHGRSVCGRVAIPLETAARRALDALLVQPPAYVDGHIVRAAAPADGLHLGFDDGFLMLRHSGTEPVVRVYAEAPSDGLLQRRLACGIELLGDPGP